MSDDERGDRTVLRFVVGGAALTAVLGLGLMFVALREDDEPGVPRVTAIETSRPIHAAKRAETAVDPPASRRLESSDAPNPALLPYETERIEPPARARVRVVDVNWAPVIGATLRVFGVAPAQSDVLVQERVTDSEGWAALEFAALGTYRLRIEAPRFAALDVPIDGALGVGDRTFVTYRIEPAAWSRIQGRLLDPDGQPLAADALAWLLADDVPAEFAPLESEICPADAGVRYFRGSANALRAWDAGSGATDPTAYEARVEEDRAAFAIDVPFGFIGTVGLSAFGRVLAARDWREGDGPLDLIVDAPAERARLGSLLVRIPGGGFALRVAVNGPVDAASDVRISYAGHDLPSGLELRDLLAGTYLVNARSRSRGAQRLVEVAPGTRTLLELDLEELAILRVRVDGVPGLNWDALRGGLAARSEDGALLATVARVDEVQDGLVATLKVPAGAVVLRYDWTALRLEVAPGEEREARLTVASPGNLTLRFTIPGAVDGIPPTLRVRAWQGPVRVQEWVWTFGRPGAGGAYEFDLTVPEGEYRLAVDGGPLGRAEGPVRVVANRPNEAWFTLR